MKKNFQRYFYLYHVLYTLKMYELRNKFSDKYHFLSHEKFQKLDIDYQYHMNDNTLIKVITIYTSY